MAIWPFSPKNSTNVLLKDEDKWSFYLLTIRLYIYIYVHILYLLNLNGSSIILYICVCLEQ